jgi:hypothetical protein
MTVAPDRTDLDVRPVAGHIGAEIIGVTWPVRSFPIPAHASPRPCTGTK